MPVYVFGSNAISQFGLGEDYESTHIPQRIPFFDNLNIKKIKCGTIHTLVITDDDKLYSWGCNDEYALGRDGDEFYPGEVHLPEKPLDITCGASISACLTENNNVYVWGTFRNFNGVFGLDKNTKIQKTPRKVLAKFGNFKFTSIESGSNFICLLNKDKTIWTFGSNDFYELGRRTSQRFKDSSLFPGQIFSGRSKKDNHRFNLIRCGLNHAMAVNTNNEVYTWGSNIYGQLGIGHDEETKRKHKLSLNDIVECAGGEHHSLFLDKNGNLYGSGRNEQGQLGLTSRKDYHSPEFIIDNVKKIRSYENYSICQIGDDLYSFGVSFSGATGFIENEIFTPTKIPYDFGEILEFVVGSNFTIVVTK